MPTAPLVADDYIDDPNRTTEEVQDALNSHLDFSREIKFELSTLSSTTFREAAVRGVGDALTEVPDNDELNSRLGTTGNLGNAATKTMGAGGGLDADLLDGKEGADYLSRDATLLYDGSTYGPISVSAFGPDPGIYVVVAGDNAYSVVIRDSSEDANGSSAMTLISTEIREARLVYRSGNGFELQRKILIRSSGAISQDSLLMNQLYKL